MDPSSRAQPKPTTTPPRLPSPDPCRSSSPSPDPWSSSPDPSSWIIRCCCISCMDQLADAVFPEVLWPWRTWCIEHLYLLTACLPVLNASAHLTQCLHLLHNRPEFPSTRMRARQRHLQLLVFKGVLFRTAMEQKEPTCYFSKMSANYLNIKGLLDLTCQTVADMIKGKTPEEICKTFNIKNAFMPEEEEEEIRRENQCAFE